MAHPPPLLAAALAAKAGGLHHVDAPTAPAPKADGPPQPPNPTHAAGSVVGAQSPSISLADISNRAAGLRHVDGVHTGAHATAEVPHLPSHPVPSHPPTLHAPPTTLPKLVGEHSAPPVVAHRPVPIPGAHPTTAEATHGADDGQHSAPPSRPPPPVPAGGRPHPPLPHPSPATAGLDGSSHGPPPPVPPHTEGDASVPTSGALPPVATAPNADSSLPPVPPAAHRPPPPVPPHTAADASAGVEVPAAPPAEGLSASNKAANIPIVPVQAPPSTVDFNTVSSVDGLPKAKFSVFIYGAFGLYLNGVKEALAGTHTPQTWEVTRLPDGTVWFYLPETQRYVTAEKFLGIAGEVTVRCHQPKDFEQWTINYQGPNTFGLKSKHGYFMSFDADGHVRVKDDEIAATEKHSSVFHFRSTDSNAPEPLPTPIAAPVAASGGLLSRIFGGSTEPSPSEVQISSPSNFQHAVHVGFDAKTGLDISQLPPEWRRLFQQAGVKKSELKNPETAAALLDTVMAPLPPPPPPAGAPHAPLPLVGAAHPPGAPPPPPAGAPPGPSRGPSLADQIKNRGELKKVELPDIKDKNETELQPMRSALEAVIAARRKAMAPDEATPEDNDEWKD